MISNFNAGGRRISQLDGVRGVAILLVLVYHYFYWGIAKDVIHPHTALSHIRGVFALTWSGVDLFFVLSGFLIAGILIDHKTSPNYYQVFYLRRACRILPPYCIVLAVFVCISFTPLFHDARFSDLFHDAMPLWSYATFTQNCLMGVAGSFGATWLSVTWSLAMEEQFYLIMPLLIRSLPGRSIIYAFFGAILAMPLLRCGVGDFQRYVYTPCHGDPLLLGACLAVLVRSPNFLAFVKEHVRFVRIIFLILLGGAVIMTVHLDSFGVFDFSWLAVFYSALILLALLDGGGTAGYLLNLKPLVWLGARSYMIYLIHSPVIGLLYGHFRGGPPRAATLSDIGITGLAVLLTFIVAALSYRFFERPILGIGHRFHYENTAPEAANAGLLKSNDARGLQK